MNLSQFLEALDQHPDAISLERLQELLSQLEIDDDFWQRYVHFDSAKYRRNLLHRCENFEALVLCFESGQRTPIHDHAGSACGVRVLEGVGMETIYERTEDGWLYATGTQELPRSGIVGSNDMDIHQLSNLQSGGRRMVTLHIYSPPLGEVGNYCVEDNTVRKVTAETRELAV